YRESGASSLSPKCVICGQPLKRYGEFANGTALSLADAYVRIRFAIFLARIFVSRPCTAWRAAPHSGLARKGAGFLHHRFRNIDL
ncbi:hypothetical protein, partial [Aeromonas veronii]|uniref:hypothetical protein n=1 Tax=Aeromonas veronii TaxID=654 RepID=UPI00195BE4DC